MAERGVLSTQGAEGWGRVMGEDKVIQGERVEGDRRGPAMKLAEY